MRFGTSPLKIQVADLRPLAEEALTIDDGGTATIDQVRYRGSTYVFKRYRVLASPAELTKLIRWGRSLPVVERAALRAKAAWPKAVVYDGDRFVGLLVPLAPARFIADGQPRSLDLLGDDEQAKLVAFGHLIAAVAWFHDRGVVVNDLTAPNILVAEAGDGVHLVDCDSMVGRHWAPVLPKNAAPEDVRDVVGDVDDPTAATDYARLAHTIICSLFDAEVVDVDDRHPDLVRVVGPETAAFLCAAKRMTLGDGSEEIWRLLGDRWLGGDGTGDILMSEAPLYDESRMPGLDGWMFDDGLRRKLDGPPLRWTRRMTLAAAVATALALIGLLAGIGLR